MAQYDPDRREFGKMALGGALGSALLGSAGHAGAVTPQFAPGLKICVQSAPNPTANDLLFLKQLGVGYVSVGAPANMRTAEGFSEIKKRYADGGITVWNIGNTSVHNMP